MGQGSRTRTCHTHSSENFHPLEKGGQPLPGTRFPPRLRLTPLAPHSCHAFGLRPNRASPVTPQPYSCYALHSAGGFLALASLSRPVRTSFLAWPSRAKMPGRRKPHALIPQNPPDPPPGVPRPAPAPAAYRATAATRLPCGASGFTSFLFFPTLGTFPRTAGFQPAPPSTFIIPCSTFSHPLSLGS